jgi:outer membrane receptor protein involved in Fe transport
MGGAGALWEKKENLPTIRPQYRGTPKFNPSVALNYRDGATNSFVQADWLYSPTLNKNEFSTRTYDDGTVIVQQIKRNRRTDYATLNAGVDHEFDARNTVRVAGLFNREKILDYGDNPYFDGALQNRYRLWQFLEDEVKYTAFGTAALVHKFPQAGHTLTVTSNYSFHREDEQYFFTNTLTSFVGKDAFKLLSDEHVVDFNADYVKPLRQGRFEGGFKGRYRSIPVNMRFFPGQNTPIDTGAGGKATYREKIPAIYGNYVFESQRLELEGGVRFEGVQVDYDVNPNHNTYKSDGYRYFQPFPNVRAAWKFDDANKLSLFFNRRVDRPNEVDIRIFPKYDEPELIKVGNPALQPQYSTSTELGYKTSWPKGSLYAAAFHRIVDGTITRIATQAPGSVLLYNVFQNAGRSWSTGGEVVWQQSLAANLLLNANANIYRRTVDAFSVVNKYPVPVTYDRAARAAHVWQRQAQRDHYPAQRLAAATLERLPRPRPAPAGAPRESLLAGCGRQEERAAGEGRAGRERDRPTQHQPGGAHDPRNQLPAREHRLPGDAGRARGVQLEVLNQNLCEPLCDLCDPLCRALNSVTQRFTEESRRFTEEGGA